jgi:hypothetical protein
MNSQALNTSIVSVMILKSLLLLPACQPAASHSQSLHTGNVPMPEKSSPPVSQQDSPDSSYWTPERMKKAQPMPIPAIPDPSIQGEVPSRSMPPGAEPQEEGGEGGSQGMEEAHPSHSR